MGGRRLVTTTAFSLAGCSSDEIRPMNALNGSLERSSDARRDPSMAQGGWPLWLARTVASALS